LFYIVSLRSFVLTYCSDFNFQAERSVSGNGVQMEDRHIDGETGYSDAFSKYCVKFTLSILYVRFPAANQH